MAQKLEILETLPGVGLQSIKDGWRSIALSVWGKKQQLADWVGHTLRNVLKLEGVSEVTPEEVTELAQFITGQREKIIELLQDRECIKVIVGSSKREKAARLELAWKVLDEILARVSSYAVVE